MQEATELLTLCIATGVCSGPGLLNAIERTQGFHQFRFKVPTLGNGSSGGPHSVESTHEPVPWPLSLLPDCTLEWPG